MTERPDDFEPVSDARWPSFTRKMSCPEGSAWINVAYNAETRMPEKIWLWIGKGGSAWYAAGHGISAAAKLALDSGASISEVVRYLRGISHADSNPLAYDAQSMADALAIALEEEYLR